MTTKRKTKPEKKIMKQGWIETKTKKNKVERYSRVPRLSDTRYSANGTKGKWRYASSKARLKCAPYRR